MYVYIIFRPGKAKYDAKSLGRLVTVYEIAYSYRNLVVFTQIPVYMPLVWRYYARKYNLGFTNPLYFSECDKQNHRWCMASC
jgi:hypothetical protein